MPREPPVTRAVRPVSCIWDLLPGGKVVHFRGVSIAEGVRLLLERLDAEC